MRTPAAHYRPPADAPHAAFAAYISELALRHPEHYDLHPKTGGRSRLARAAGFSASSMSRIADGKALPDIDFYEPLAEALGADVNDLLIRSGAISEKALHRSHTMPIQSKTEMTTWEQVADQLGIYDPVDREILRRTIDDVQSRAQRPATGGGAAAMER